MFYFILFWLISIVAFILFLIFSPIVKYFESYTEDYNENDSFSYSSFIKKYSVAEDYINDPKYYSLPINIYHSDN